MLKRNPKPYMASVSFKNDAFGNEVEMKRLFDHPELIEFLVADGFSNEVASYIVTALEMEKTKFLRSLHQAEIETELPNLTPKDKKHLLDIVRWTRKHKRMIASNFD